MTMNEITLSGTRSLCKFQRLLLSLQVETLPYRREILRWDSLLTVDCRLKVGSWNSYPLPVNFAESSATGNVNSLFFCDIMTSFAFSRLGYVSDASNFPNQSECLPSKFLRNQSIADENVVVKNFLSEQMDSRFVSFGVWEKFHLCAEWNNWSFE